MVDRPHRAALAVWFTTLIRGPQWTIHFGNNNSNKEQQQQQAIATATATSNNRWALIIISRVRRSPKGPELGQRVPYLRRCYSPRFGSKLTNGHGWWAKKSLKSGIRTKHLTKWAVMRNLESTCLMHAKVFPSEAQGRARPESHVTP